MTNFKTESQDFYCRWGKPGQGYGDQEVKPFFQFLTKQLELQTLPDKTPPPAWQDFAIPPPKLPQEFVQAWNAHGLSTEPSDRLSHTAGKSYRDLIRLRNKKDLRFPDGVLYLQREEDLTKLFEDVRKHAITMIPFGGGTGVVGGTDCVGPLDKPILVVDLKYLNQLIAYDEISQTATFQAGILGPELEAALNAKGYTLGHFPQSFEFSTLGGWAATRSAGQNSTKYGKIEKMIEALKIHTPQGIIETQAVPASATGPSLKEILIGSEGIFGIITQVTFKIWKQPAEQKFLAGFFKNFETGIQFVRKIMQQGLHPSIVRLSDPEETKILMQLQKPSGGFKKLLSWFLKKKLGPTPCFLLIATEGSEEEVGYQFAHLKKLFKKAGGVSIPAPSQEKWKKDRFRLPYLREPLLDHHFFIDTLETAVKWSQLEKLHRAMTDAFLSKDFQKENKLVMGCHLSHAYLDGASLYFTFLGLQQKDHELEQWKKIKSQATEIIVNYKGALSHHHGIGYDHQPWMKKECGPLGLEVFKQLKNSLDPNHLLNPSKVI